MTEATVTIQPIYADGRQMSFAAALDAIAEHLSHAQVILREQSLREVEAAGGDVVGEKRGLLESLSSEDELENDLQDVLAKVSQINRSLGLI